MNKHMLWIEKYRPQKVDDCILPEKNKKSFKEFVQVGKLPNLILTGTAGIGKTTVAKAICNELKMDFIVINASENGNIDTLRTTIRQFASTVSLDSSARKCVILDEADYLNAQSTQPALRGFIEEFAGNCSFIFTCNYLNRLIEPLHSRCSVVEFKIAKSEKPIIAVKFLERLKFILKNENVSYDENVLVELIKKYFPDFRRCINELQRYSPSGKIDAGILVNLSEIKVNELLKSLQNKEFEKIRKWVVENSDNDSSRIFRTLYDNLQSKLKPHSIPQAILIIADYQYKAAFVADPEINIMACLINIMIECEWI